MLRFPKSNSEKGSKFYNNRNKLSHHRYTLNQRTNKIVNILNDNSINHRKLLILDIGCADGLMTRKLFYQTNCKQIIGIEKNRDFHYKEIGNNIDFIHSDASNLSLHNNSIDVVVASALLKHIKNPAIVIGEIYRIMKGNGLLIVCDPRPFVIKFGIILRKFDKKWIYNFWTLEDYNFYFSQKGFKLTYADYYMPLIPLSALFEKMLKVLKFNFAFFHQIAAFKK